MAENINDIIQRTPSGGVASLPSGEFEGPVYITKPIRLVGKGTTIWAKRGSIIEITSRGAGIESLRVELTEGNCDSAAIVSHFPAEVHDVEVAGSVSGFGAEDGAFDIPRTAELGTFAADSVNTFVMTVNVPTDAVIQCDTPGLTFSPCRLSSGRNEITITVDPLGAQTFLYAEVLIKTRFIRRIYVTGRPAADAPTADNRCIYTAPLRMQTAAAAPPSGGNTDVISVDMPAPVYDMPLLEMRRGQRVALYQYIGGQCRISFSCASKPSGFDIDPYLFLLDGNERSLGDRGLVFFGNESSENGEAIYSPAGGHMELNLSRMDYRIQKITLAYSIYAGGGSKSFSQVAAPRVTVSAGGRERIRFAMDGLSGETTVVALEFYLYKGEWKLSAVGAGFRDGMARLCSRYGIEVEE